MTGKSDQNIKCPVCLMGINVEHFKYSYRESVYYFCSEQCKKRFVDHPKLFVGDPKRGYSPKQNGETVMKKHRIRLGIQLTQDQIQEVHSKLLSLMGLESVVISENDLQVTYDLLQVSLVQIEMQIIQVLGNCDTPLLEKIKNIYIREIEECELDNLER